MRASLFFAGLTAASLLGAGAVAVGCSSSSSGSPANTEDAAADGPAVTDDSSTPVDSGGGDAAPCVPVGANSATLDAGSASWACYQTACATQLAACATDCLCNNAIIGALQCSAPDAAAATDCFTAGINAIIAADMTNATAIGLCLMQNKILCNGDGGVTPGDGAAPEAGPTEAGADAGDGG